MNFPTGKKVFRHRKWKKIELRDLADKELQGEVLALIARDNEAQEPPQQPFETAQAER